MQIASIIGGFIVVWIILLVLLGYTQVETGAIATVKRLGDFDGWVLNPGPHWIIPFVDKADYHSSRTHEDEFPANPEDVEKDDEDNVPPGKKAPYRIVQTDAKNAIFHVQDPVTSTWKTVPFGDPFLTASQWQTKLDDALEVSLTSEVQFIVEWDIDQGSIRNYIENTGSRAMVLQRMEDMIPRLLQEFLGPITAGHARDVMVHLSELIQQRLMINVGQIADSSGKLHDKPWGINIRNAYIKSLDPGKTVNVARSEAGAAVARKQATIETASGKATGTRLEADATAYAETTVGVAKATAFERMAATLGTEGGYRAAQLETAKEVLGKAGTIVVPGDMAGVIASVTAVAKAAAK